MLKKLFTYSATRTKTAAMQARHLSDKQYAELCSKPTVADACSYLKNNTVYAWVFEGYNERNLHRGDIEAMLDGYMQSEVKKLYNFCPPGVRTMLSYTHIRYEIEQIKAILRGIIIGDPVKIKYDTQNFFLGKLTIDLDKLAASTSVREFLQATAGTPYFDVLSPPLSQPNIDLYTLEMHLDIYYFKHMWMIKDKVLHGEDREIIKESFGSEIDMINLIWIYRCKRYYNMDNDLIYTSIIPIHYKISKTSLAQKINTPDLQGFIKLAQQTRYAGLFDDLDTRFIEQNYANISHRRMRNLVKKHTFSIACAMGYVHFLELEITRIITAIESIRYGINA